MQKILVALDGSTSSRKAVDFAIKMAKTHPAAVVNLLHVTPPSLDGSLAAGGIGSTPLVSARNMENLKKRGEKLVDEAADKVKHEGIKTEKLVLDGNPGHVIAETANSKNVDLIIMGTRGLSDLKGLLVGSVSHQVLHLAKCPVTLVK